MSKQIEEVMALVDAHAKAQSEYDAHLDDVPMYDEGMDLARAQLDKKREAIESKLRELLPVWQPIESAPEKLGVYVFNDKTGELCVAAKIEGGFYSSEIPGYLDPAPTHWMPLPKAPE